MWTQPIKPSPRVGVTSARGESKSTNSRVTAGEKVSSTSRLAREQSKAVERPGIHKPSDGHSKIIDRPGRTISAAADGKRTTLSSSSSSTGTLGNKSARSIDSKVGVTSPRSSIPRLTKKVGEASGTKTTTQSAAKKAETSSVKVEDIIDIQKLSIDAKPVVETILVEETKRIPGTNCLLLSLYQSILIPILVDWIFDDEVCHLDTALTSSKFRVDFVSNTFPKCHLVNTNLIATHYHERLEWYWLREFGLRRFKFEEPDQLNPEGIAYTLAAASRHIVFLEADDSPELEQLLQSVPGCIDTLKPHVKGKSHRLDSLLPLAAAKNVTHLDLSYAFDLTEEIYALVARLCPGLKRLTVPRSDCCPAFLTNLEDRLVEEVECSAGTFCEGIPTTLDHSGLFVKTTGPADAATVQWKAQNYVMKTLHCVQYYGRESPVQYLSAYIDHLESFRFELCDRPKHFQYELITAVTKKCTRLTHVVMYHVNFDGNDFMQLIQNNKQTLRQLTLCRCDRVTSADVEAVTECPRLELLKLLNVSVKESSALAVAQRCPRLTSLYVGGTVLSDLTLNYLAGKVKSCSLEPTESISFGLTEKGTAEDAFTYCSYHSVEYPLHRRVLELNPGLLKFSANKTVEVDSGLIQCLARCCPLLTSLSITYCRNVDGRIFDSISQFKRLRHASFVDMHGIGDNRVANMLRAQPYLESLTLSSCTGFTGAVLSLVAQHCPYIKHVDVSMCNVITDEGVIELLTYCPYLDYLNCNSCKLTAAVLPHLAANQVMRFLDLSYNEIRSEEKDEFLANSGFRWTCALHFGTMPASDITVRYF